TVAPSAVRPRSSASACTAWPPMMSALVATSATRNDLDRMAFGYRHPWKDRLRDRGRSGEEGAAPQLEREHRPQLDAEVVRARAGPQQALEGPRLEDVTRATVRREEQVAGEAAQRSAEPAPEGDREAALGAVERRVRHQPPQRALEQVLRRAGAQPGAQRQRRRAL